MSGPGQGTSAAEGSAAASGSLPAVIGVVGAGTMGRGIAQLACTSGARTVVHDAAPGQAERSLESIRAQLAKLAECGRLSEDAAREASARLEAGALGDLSSCDLVIEAAPEDLALKQELFERLSSDVVGADCVLATNTSSLLVTAIAARATRPERVVGMHFFNPAPVMPLLEVIAGEATAPWAVAVAYATGEAFGKRVVRAPDAAGFIANRCQTPYFLEGLRLVEEGIASVEQVDRICRLAAGFPMGPFELMDLIGLDVLAGGLRHLFHESYGEPRWRPSPLLDRMVLARRTGRKAGRGFHDYGSQMSTRSTASVPEPGGGDGRPVVIEGAGACAADLRALAGSGGWRVLDRAGEGDGPGVLHLHLDGPLRPVEGAHRAVSCAAGSLARLDPAGGAVGFLALPPLRNAKLTELARGPATTDQAAAAAESFFRSLGNDVEWVRDAPGLVSARIVAQLMNEASFMLDWGLASGGDVDVAMTLGYGYPLGPVGWLDEAGAPWALAVLDGLVSEYGEDRYRASPGLRRRVWTAAAGPTGRSEGG